MSVGALVDSNQVNGTLGVLSRTILNWSSDIDNFKAYIDGITNLNDMHLLSQIFNGVVGIDPPRDLSVFVKRVAGIVL